jgi:hypothetical protein
MKTPRTKNGIRVQVGERKSRLFLVPKDRADSIVRLIQDFEIKEEATPWREPVKDLTEKYSEAGVALKGARGERPPFTEVRGFPSECNVLHRS